MPIFHYFWDLCGNLHSKWVALDLFTKEEHEKDLCQLNNSYIHNIIYLNNCTARNRYQSAILMKTGFINSSSIKENKLSTFFAKQM